MNHYEDAIKQAAIDRNREQRILEDALRQAHDMVIHKGQWCPFEDGTFCQEDSGCPNCEVFIRSKGDTNEIRQ